MLSLSYRRHQIASILATCHGLPEDNQLFDPAVSAIILSRRLQVTPSPTTSSLPSVAPTKAPTDEPSPAPSKIPTDEPTKAPVTPIPVEDAVTVDVAVSLPGATREMNNNEIEAFEGASETFWSNELDTQVECEVTGQTFAPDSRRGRNLQEGTLTVDVDVTAKITDAIQSSDDLGEVAVEAIEESPEVFVEELQEEVSETTGSSSDIFDNVDVEVTFTPEEGGEEGSCSWWNVFCIISNILRSIWRFVASLFSFF